MKKSLMALCLALALGTTPAWAATAENGYAAIPLTDGKAVLTDSAGEIRAETQAGEDSGEYEFTVTPGGTYYLDLGAPGESGSLLKTGDGSLTQEAVDAAELADASLFKLKIKKSGSGAGLVSVAQYSKKSMGEDQCALQFVVANTVATEDLQADCRLTFSALRPDSGGRFLDGDYADLTVKLRIEPAGRPDSGGEPEPKETDGHDEALWEGVAKLVYPVGDWKVQMTTDAESFYDLGDEAGAELFVRDFTGTPALEGGGQALLTLYDPWQARGDGSPEQRHIYERDGTGKLTDITGLFTYREDDGAACWQMRTRRPGCYILSDRAI